MKGDKSVAVLISNFDSKYTPEIFLKPIITDIDIEFSKKLMEDNHDWLLIYSNTQMQLNTFLMEKSYFPKISFLKNTKILKIEIILPFALNICINELTSIEQYKNLERMILKIESVSYLSSDEMKKKFPEDVEGNSIRGNAIFWQSNKINSISKLRKSLNVATSFFDNGDYIRIYKSIKPDFVNDEDDWKRIHFENESKKEFLLSPGFGFFKLTSISANKTRLTDLMSKILLKKKKFNF